MLALINQSYELNEKIPNSETLFYKIFMTPLETYESRKKNLDADKLKGNIF